MVHFCSTKMSLSKFNLYPTLSLYLLYLPSFATQKHRRLVAVCCYETKEISTTLAELLKYPILPTQLLFFFSNVEKSPGKPGHDAMRYLYGYVHVTLYVCAKHNLSLQGILYVAESIDRWLAALFHSPAG